MMKYILSAILLVFMTLPAYAESAYDRVISNGEIKCGYIIYPPLIDRDVNTGQFSGFNYEIMEAIGKKLDLKINWFEETGTDNAFSGLETNRYDVVCAGFWEIATRARAAMFTDPLYYEGLYAFNRVGDDRFDAGPQTINKQDVKIVVLEGEMSQHLARELFPDAKMILQPGLTGASVRFLDVASGKADVTFNELPIFNDFNKENPNQVKLLYDSPLSVNNASFSVAKGEHTLLEMLNSTINELQNAGTIKAILKKYDPSGKMHIPIKPSYEVPE